MKVLILEDEPLIALDLEDIVCSSQARADCLIAPTLERGLTAVREGVDFALLDISLGDGRSTSLPVAAALRRRNIPFCFVSSDARSLPADFRDVPFVAKPFMPETIRRVLPQRH